MDAVKFLKEKQRMCEDYLNVYDECQREICPMAIKLLDMKYCSEREFDSIMCCAFVKEYPEQAVEVVEQWSKDNPREIDWTKVPPNTPVLIRDEDDENWEKRMFAICLPNALSKFYCFSNGSDWESAFELTLWQQCKLDDSINPEPYYKE